MNKLDELKEINEKIEKAYCLLEEILIDVSNIIADTERNNNKNTKI